MHFSDNKHYIHYLVNNKTALFIKEFDNFVEKTIVNELGKYIYEELVDRYYHRHTSKNQRSINVYRHMIKILKGIYLRKRLLAEIDLTERYPYIKDAIELDSIQNDITYELDDMWLTLSLYFNDARKIFHKNPFDPSNITLSAGDCFFIFSNLIKTPLSMDATRDDYLKNLLMNLWEHSADSDRANAIRLKFQPTQMKIWGILSDGGKQNGQ